MAKYICVLVAGYVETAVQELTIVWCRKQSGPSVLRFVTRQLEKPQNLNGQRLRQALDDFDREWATKLDDLSEEVDALNSIYGNRNQIAHGVNVGLTLAQVRKYYESVQRLVDLMVDLMDPVPAVR